MLTLTLPHRNIVIFCYTSENAQCTTSYNLDICITHSIRRPSLVLVNVLVWVLRGVCFFQQRHICTQIREYDVGMHTGIWYRALPSPPKPLSGKVAGMSAVTSIDTKYHNLKTALRRDYCR